MEKGNAEFIGGDGFSGSLFSEVKTRPISYPHSKKAYEAAITMLTEKEKPSLSAHSELIKPSIAFNCLSKTGKDRRLLFFCYAFHKVKQAMRSAWQEVRDEDISLPKVY